MQRVYMNTQKILLLAHCRMAGTYKCRKQPWYHQKCIISWWNLCCLFKRRWSCDWKYWFNTSGTVPYKSQWHRNRSWLLDRCPFLGKRIYSWSSASITKTRFWGFRLHSNVVRLLWWKWKIKTLSGKVWIWISSYRRKQTLCFDGRCKNRAFYLSDKGAVDKEWHQVKIFWILY